MLSRTRPNLTLATKYSSSSAKEDGENERKLKIGNAIDTLQTTLPYFFRDGLADHHMYHPHILLHDPQYTKIRIHGRTAYIGLSEMLRYSVDLYYRDITFEVLNMRVMDDTKQAPTRLQVRWQLEGLSRASAVMSSGAVTKSTFEGVFQYTFDASGDISEHRIESINPAPSRRVIFLHGIGGRIRAWWEGRRIPELSPANLEKAQP
ncbi:hypothetical protein INT44_001271 [Umbelopsis vinacea]|uniref:Uncharacterized protein n=1 Tax=Umbelopsis vinacea TaxID=44442 RepID=A0A8H7Q9N5_9FUNG|nr:hypothetical protein INT44_001271 [Umbelopsis vinacea]